MVNQPDRPNLHRNAAFRWHFYAAIFVLPVLLMLSVTGFVILLKPTFERMFYGELLYVNATESAQPLDDQLGSVLQQHPEAVIDSIVPPRDRERSTQFDITNIEGKSLSVYVRPSDSQVLGHIDNDTRIDYVATRIHGTFLIGKWGDYLIEIASGWLLVMVATGVYLWAPKKWIPGSLIRAFVPRVRRGGRKPWRDAHGIAGIIAAPLLVFLVVTGLPWSGFWGERVWTPLIDSMNQGINYPEEEPVSTPSADSLKTSGLSVTWGTGMNNVPLSTSSLGTTLTLEQVRQIAETEGLLPGYGIGLPVDEYGVFTLANSWPSPAEDERMLFIDQYSGEVIDEVGWNSSYGSLAKATTWGVNTHMGRQLGTANGVAMGVACLAGIGSALTAPIMYLKRRRKGSLSLPATPLRYRPPLGVKITVVIVSIIYPLFGASMLMVIAIDRVLFRPLRDLETTT